MDNRELQNETKEYEAFKNKTERGVRVRRYAIRVFIVLIGVALFLGLGTHSIFYSYRLHSSIESGMAARHVVELIEENQLTNTIVKYQILELLKTFAPSCRKLLGKNLNNYGQHSGERDGRYFCYYHDHSVESFLKKIQKYKDNTDEFEKYEIRILLVFRGPTFLKSSFDILFDSQGKVQKVTEIEHWQ